MPPDEPDQTGESWIPRTSHAPTLGRRAPPRVRLSTADPDQSAAAFAGTGAEPDELVEELPEPEPLEPDPLDEESLVEELLDEPDDSELPLVDAFAPLLPELPPERLSVL